MKRDDALAEIGRLQGELTADHPGGLARTAFFQAAIGRKIFQE